MKYLNALNKIPGVGPKTIAKLTAFLGDSENAWKAPLKDLTQSGIGDKLAQKIAAEREKINPDEEWEALAKEGIDVLSLADPHYPKLLKEIPSPPPLLYIKGEINFNSYPLVSVVGSRKFTYYGKQAAYGFARDLAAARITVISGMALGIDSFAHYGALEANGKTIAVLGSSLEDKYVGPRTNFELSRKIIGSGALVSEYPMGTPASPGNFPARNRIMAGISMGTLVIEAAENSGSLITAYLALDFNREVFAVPGSIFSPQSQGANNLIKSGAKLVSCAKDILEELRIEETKKTEELKKIIPDSKEEKRILEVLSAEPLHIDRIIKLTKLETVAVISFISIMEMKGMVKNIGGQNYIIV